jgi:hypothetical protein
LDVSGIVVINGVPFMVSLGIAAVNGMPRQMQAFCVVKAAMLRDTTKEAYCLKWVNTDA